MSSDEEARRHRVQWLRARAEEVRTVSDGMVDPTARDTMARIAETYERIADQIEGHIIGRPVKDVG
jgi:hypothetical protein